MKAKDFYFIGALILFFIPFFISASLFDFYKSINQQHGMAMSFVKFAILATLGEVIGLRIKTGHYNQPGFGIPARAIVWGLLGLTIQMAFIIFSTGTPIFLEYLGMTGASTLLQSDCQCPAKWIVAFAASTAMNLIFAPVMMTMHKITDTHIEANGGKLTALFRPIQMDKILTSINWKVQWNFVFKKTIPFFWIPAHSITFMLPTQQRVLFAALLGIMLGVFLAVAAVSAKKQD